MLFYTSIFVASLVALLVISLISRVIVSSCKAISKASARLRNVDGRFDITANAQDRQDIGVLGKPVAAASINPGANNHVTAWELANTHFAKDKAGHSKSVAWSSRATTGASFDRATKVKREQKKVTLDMVSKPFRRKASSGNRDSETLRKPTEGNVNSKTSTLDTLKSLTRRKSRPVKSDDKNINKPWGW